MATVIADATTVQQPPPPDLVKTGLTAAEVEVHRARGEVNTAAAGTGRSYLEIVRQNVFTFINTILFAIGIGLVIMGRPDDAIVTAGVVIVNVVVGVVQETRAKAKLDKIALLNRPQATAIRDSAEQVIDPAQVVLGDVLSVGPGDQIVVDGTLIRRRPARRRRIAPDR